MLKSINDKDFMSD